METPNSYDCADVATCSYGQAMEATGTKSSNDAVSSLTASGTNITGNTISNIGSTDFFPSSNPSKEK
jgi:hypothetical protein